MLTAGDGVGTGKVFHYIKGKFDFHQRVYKIGDFSERVDGYFFYLFFSTHFYERIMSMTAKSSVDSVRREMIADMSYSAPFATRATGHRHRALRHGRGDRGAGAAAGQDPRAQAGHDAGTAHREDKAGMTRLPAVIE